MKSWWRQAASPKHRQHGPAVFELWSLNQELAKQDSQGASQSPFSALYPDLQTVIAAWDKLPTALKSAVLAMVSSNREAKGYRSKPTDECRRR